jgi:hypothetical protein
MPRQGVFENVQAGGDISFRDLLQILLVPGRDGQEPERQGIRHNLPQPDYGQFVGREQELTRIFQKLRPYPYSTNSVITIDGIGGIGKSALALEVAHRFLRDYSKLPTEERFEAIIWSSAKRTGLRPDRGIVPRRQSFKTLEDICKYIAFTLAMEEQVRSSPSEVVKLVCRALTQQRTLLIIDNLETVDDEAVMEFLQETLPAPTKAIITTRHRIDIAYPVRLAGMLWKDAEQLIEQECQKKNVFLNSEEKRRLYKRTGGVPLAIVWSVAKVSFGHRIDTVLASLGTPQGDVAHFCFRGVVNDIKNRDAYKLLLALAICNGEADRNELRCVAGFGEDELSCDEGLVELEVVSLINRQRDVFKMLPLTKAYVIHELKTVPDFQEQAIERFKNYKLESLFIPEVKAKVSDKLEYLYSKKRVLNAQQGYFKDLYVDMRFLDKPANETFAELPNLLNNADSNELNRLGLGAVQQQHSSMNVVSQHNRLVILGQPGSGKSTYLRHLAIACCEDDFLPDYIPVLIELRFTKDIKKFSLLRLIQKEVGLENLKKVK